MERVMKRASTLSNEICVSGWQRKERKVEMEGVAQSYKWKLWSPISWRDTAHKWSRWFAHVYAYNSKIKKNTQTPQPQT